MTRTEDGWYKEYVKRQAIFEHDGNKLRPHAQISSRLHSAGFFNSQPIINDHKLLTEAAEDLAQLFMTESREAGRAKLAIGPQTGGRYLAECLSNAFTRINNDFCLFASSHKRGDGESRNMVFKPDDIQLVTNLTVILCDDVLTTGGSLKMTDEAITRCGGKTLDYVLVLVNRSGKEKIFGKKIISLVDRFIPNWPASDCPLCRDGSEALRPKGKNWDLFTKEY